MNNSRSNSWLFLLLSIGFVILSALYVIDFVYIYIKSGSLNFDDYIDGLKSIGYLVISWAFWHEYNKKR